MSFDRLRSVQSWLLELNQRNLDAYSLTSWLIEEGYEFIWHPLGFAMCRIGKWDSVSLRAHVWPADLGNQQKPAWLIHDHRFHLTSWVLSGGIENKEYDIDPSGSDHVIYSASYDLDRSILNRTNISCSKELVRNESFREGQVYEVNSGVFHDSVSQPQCSSFTICKTVDELDSHPRVLGERHGQHSYTFFRRQVSMSELRKLLSEI